MSLKNNILVELTNSNEELSGQMLADKYNVSRSAVWKAVNSLRASGYSILSTTNRGYILDRDDPDADILNADVIRENLNPNIKQLRVYTLIDSTNNEAKRLLSENTENATSTMLLISDWQTAGRGRLGRSFLSPRGTGLYMTLVLHPNDVVENVVGVTTFAAVCVARSIKRVLNIDAGIKWVNDVYIDGRKVCGILTEAVSDFETGRVSSVIIGIGLNLRPFDVPEDLLDKVGFINPDRHCKNELATSIANELYKYSPTDRDYINESRRLSCVVGRNITFTENGKNQDGVATSIDDEGGLVVVLSDGSSTTLRSGEISVKLNN